MSKTRIVSLTMLAVLVLALAVAVASCGGSTTTTGGPATTAAPATTNAPSTTASSQTDTTAAATSTTASAAIDPAALYAQNCSSCHSSVPGTSAAQATRIINSGRETMPSFTDKLTVDEIAALAAWVANGGK
jgi:mono/diheme cytochrome c family protein